VAKKRLAKNNIIGDYLICFHNENHFKKEDELILEKIDAIRCLNLKIDAQNKEILKENQTMLIAENREIKNIIEENRTVMNEENKEIKNIIEEIQKSIKVEKTNSEKIMEENQKTTMMEIQKLYELMLNSVGNNKKIAEHLSKFHRTDKKKEFFDELLEETSEGNLAFQGFKKEISARLEDGTIFGGIFGEEKN